MAAAAAAPPSPKSPPRCPDLCGRRRLQLEVQTLNREIAFLEDELRTVDGAQPASECCKGVNDFVGSKPDPLMPQTKICFFFPWICCCTSEPPAPAQTRCSTIHPEGGGGGPCCPCEFMCSYPRCHRLNPANFCTFCSKLSFRWPRCCSISVPPFAGVARFSFCPKPRCPGSFSGCAEGRICRCFRIFSCPRSSCGCVVSCPKLPVACIGPMKCSSKTCCVSGCQC